MATPDESLRDRLNGEVSAAIIRAERLEDDGEDAVEAYREVFRCEMSLVDIYTPDSVEGQIARRGAVSAALKSANRELAEELAKKYLNEEGVVASVRIGISELLQE